MSAANVVSSNTSSGPSGFEKVRVPAGGDLIGVSALSSDYALWLEILDGQDTLSKLFAVRVYWEQPSVSYV